MMRLPVPIVVIIGFLTACHTPLEIHVPNICPVTPDLGNRGCFEVDGEVVDTTGHPLSGISVAVRPDSGPRFGFSTVYQLTDVTGAFRIREARFLGGPRGNGAPDTVGVYVVATDPRSAGVNAPASVQDSVHAVVTIAPAGRTPIASEVRITLPEDER